MYNCWPHENKTIPQFSLIYSGEFHDVNVNSDGTNKAMWCHDASNWSPDNGLRYGTQVHVYNPTKDKYLWSYKLVTLLDQILIQVQYSVRGSKVRLH